MKELYTLYPILNLTPQDILIAFEGHDREAEVKQKLTKMDDCNMEYLAEKLRDDYTEQLYWDSLRAIFESRFLK